LTGHSSDIGSSTLDVRCFTPKIRQELRVIIQQPSDFPARKQACMAGRRVIYFADKPWSPDWSNLFPDLNRTGYDFPCSGVAVPGKKNDCL
jgi:hypothetical protein